MKKKIFLFLSIVAVASVLFQAGCITTRGVIYLNPEKATDYLNDKRLREREPQSEEQKLVESAVKEAKELLKEMPASDKILGGFCTDQNIRKELLEIQDLARNCRKKLKDYQNRGNLFTILTWSLTGGTAATGLVMFFGGIFPKDPNTRVGLVLGFGIPMVVFALTNSFAPFARIGSRMSAKASALDSYLWTMRQRVLRDICTAPSKEIAIYRVKSIKSNIAELCPPEVE